jgi:hypothetical protein
MVSSTVSGDGSAIAYVFPADCGKPLRYSIAFITKSRGTTLKR